MLFLLFCLFCFVILFSLFHMTSLSLPRQCYMLAPHIRTIRGPHGSCVALTPQPLVPRIVIAAHSASTPLKLSSLTCHERSIAYTLSFFDDSLTHARSSLSSGTLNHRHFVHPMHSAGGPFRPASHSNGLWYRRPRQGFGLHSFHEGSAGYSLGSPRQKTFRRLLRCHFKGASPPCVHSLSMPRLQ